MEASCSSLDLTVKVMIFLTDIKRFSELNEIYSGYFGTSKPARACVEVSNLPKGVFVEMDATAMIAE